MGQPDLSFYWNQANIEHIGKHGVSANEAEFVVRSAVEPFP
jgi:hypothetical protein